MEKKSAARPSPYITPAGYRKLEQEHAVLWQRRKHVSRALSEAAAEGDRSENAEYIYRKKELREIDRRIRYLQKRMPILNMVRNVGSREKVYFGAAVGLAAGTGEEMLYRIVGADEIDHLQGYISIDSVTARALIGKAKGDTVFIQTPGGSLEYRITSIAYQDDPE